MAAHTNDVPPMRNNTEQDSEPTAVYHSSEHEPGSTTLTEDLGTDNFAAPNVRVADDEVDVPAQPQSPRRPSFSKPDHELADGRHKLTLPQQVNLPSAPEEVSDPERAIYPAGSFTPPINADDETPMFVDHQELSACHPQMVFPAIPPRDEEEANAGNLVLGPSRMTVEERAREDIDCLLEDMSSSLPPSSSPPQLFSSSPYRSSQSSLGDVDPSKADLVVETYDGASSRPDDHGNDDCTPASEDIHNHGAAEAESENGIRCLPTVSFSVVEDFSTLSEKRAADPHESSPPAKRPNLDPHLYLPPNPKRATMASQRHQFERLSAPFRPPLRVSIDRDRQVQPAVGKKIESIMLESRSNSIQKAYTVHLPRRTPNKSKSVAQFKSPLAHGVVSAESRTVRLTPAIQSLERKLQLLKRAIKVKENNEEEDLVRLAGKWIEAGREVAYEVWDAVKDTGDFAGKAPFTRKSYGWEGTDFANTPWGWDTKHRDADEEPGDLDPSEATGATDRQALEEEGDADYNTLGTMLRQLGIAPEIFGWDDEKEAFSD